MPGAAHSPGDISVKMIKNFRNIICSIVVISAIECPLSADSQSLDGSGKVEESGQLVSIIEKLADYQNFRRKAADFDEMITGHCEKEKEIKDKFGIISKYSCAPESGIDTIRIDSREGQRENYIMTLSVYYHVQNFDKVRQAVGNKLGKESKKARNLSLWRYAADKGLNDLGSPVISISRDLETDSASFQLGLEQGP